MSNKDQDKSGQTGTTTAAGATGAEKPAEQTSITAAQLAELQEKAARADAAEAKLEEQTETARVAQEKADQALADAERERDNAETYARRVEQQLTSAQPGAPVVVQLADNSLKLELPRKADSIEFPAFLKSKNEFNYTDPVTNERYTPAQPIKVSERPAPGTWLDQQIHAGYIGEA